MPSAANLILSCLGRRTTFPNCCSPPIMMKIYSIFVIIIIIAFAAECVHRVWRAQNFYEFTREIKQKMNHRADSPEVPFGAHLSSIRNRTCRWPIRSPNSSGSPAPCSEGRRGGRLEMESGQIRFESLSCEANHRIPERIMSNGATARHPHLARLSSEH